MYLLSTVVFQLLSSNGSIFPWGISWGMIAHACCWVPWYPIVHKNSPIFWEFCWNKSCISSILVFLRAWLWKSRLCWKITRSEMMPGLWSVTLVACVLLGPQTLQFSSRTTCLSTEVVFSFKKCPWRTFPMLKDDISGIKSSGKGSELGPLLDKMWCWKFWVIMVGTILIEKGAEDVNHTRNKPLKCGSFLLGNLTH